MKITTINPCLIFFSLFFFSNNALAELEINPVPGGIAEVKISSSTRPKAKFEGNDVAMRFRQDSWFAIVGLPLTIRGRTQNLYLKKPVSKRMRFRTDRKSYKIQRLNIDNVNLNSTKLATKTRITNENELLKKTLATFTPGTPFKQNYIAPIRGWISSTFGLTRFYNGHKGNPHQGLDIVAKRGSKVVATASGTVIKTGDWLYTGNTVIINHGYGVMSLYAHLNEILVEEGQPIKQGELLGLVGATGRTTGAHLHWGVIMNQTFVDPLLFVKRQDVLPIRKSKK